MSTAKVGIIMGSQSDWATMKHAAEVLDELGVPYEKQIVSAHRTPDKLFDYAAKDEIQDGLKKVGLDPRRVKYVILSHAHGDHDGGAKILQDAIPDVRLIYGAEDWESVDKSETRAGGKPKRDLVGADGMRVSVGDASVDRHNAWPHSRYAVVLV